MKIIIGIVIFSLVVSSINANEHSEELLFEKYKSAIGKIKEYLAKDTMRSHKRLAYLCDTYGHRLSGSEGLEKAIGWIYSEMKKDGLANPHLDSVLVPNWKRGKEWAKLKSLRDKNVPMLALGGSIGTNSKVIEAKVFVAKSKEDLYANKEKAKGKIVLFNFPYQGYGKTVQYRVYGSQWASECGAIASMIRSVSPKDMNNPHTGVTYYVDSIQKIPHFAITSEDSELMARMQERGEDITLQLYMEARTESPAPSHNVMSEIVGSKYPSKIIVAGGHIDSWDVGTGAMDDASGCVATWEAVRIIKELGLNPKHTIRVCHWTNEENGTTGGKAYAEQHSNEEHIMALEFDVGVFEPKYVRFSGDSTKYNKLKKIRKLLREIYPKLEIAEGGGGVDIGPIVNLQKIPAMSLSTEDEVLPHHYFYYHHSETDTVDKIKVKDFNDCIAVLAATLYLYSELED